MPLRKRWWGLPNVDVCFLLPSPSDHHSWSQPTHTHTYRRATVQEHLARMAPAMELARECPSFRQLDEQIPGAAILYQGERGGRAAAGMGCGCMKCSSVLCFR